MFAVILRSLEDVLENNWFGFAANRGPRPNDPPARETYLSG